MPELPEVETVRRGLAPVMEGARFTKVEAHREDLRWPLPKDFTARLEGHTVQKLDRRAKYLLATLSSGEVLIMHLGMSGSFRISRDFTIRHPEALGAKRRASKGDGPDRGRILRGSLRSRSLAPQDDGTHDAAELTPGSYYYGRGSRSQHDHVIFHMSSGAVISFNDPRRFGMMKLVPLIDLQTEPPLSRLGPEPLDRGFNATVLARACTAKRTSLKAALSDQRIVAGLGNIYVCEALHRARLSPLRGASSIAKRSGQPNERAKKLVEAIKAVLQDAIASGGSSLRNHRRTDGALGDFQHNFRVYDRDGKPCPRRGCGDIIKRIVQTGRSTFFCPVCQK